MTFKQFLKEEFYTGVSIKGDGYTEVYKNPKASELKDIQKESEFGKEVYFRIGIDKDFNLYCWKVEVLHHDMEKKLNKTFPAKFVVRENSAYLSETKPTPEAREWLKDNSQELKDTIIKFFPKVDKIDI